MVTATSIDDYENVRDILTQFVRINVTAQPIQVQVRYC